MAETLPRSTVSNRLPWLALAVMKGGLSARAISPRRRFRTARPRFWIRASRRSATVSGSRSGLRIQLSWIED
ncbi:hypothetical protein D3C72_2171360 [compost metagenome]